MKKGNLNAMKHGAFAKMILLPGESEEEFNTFYEAVLILTVLCRKTRLKP